MSKLLWAVQPEWLGDTAYIIAGGPSVALQPLHLLVGRKVIAVNSSYERAAFADILFFGDNRWWEDHKHKLTTFAGRIVTVSQAAAGDHLLRLRRDAPPPGFAVDCRAVASQWTSTQGAMNLAAHLGVNRIVLLGADMCRAADGSSHHHSPHQWPNKPGDRTWDHQMRFLQMIVAPLRERGIEVFNTSAVSRIPWWPKMSLEEAIGTPPNAFKRPRQSLVFQECESG